MGWLRTLEFTEQTTRDKRATQRENYIPAGSHTREIPLRNDQLKVCDGTTHGQDKDNWKGLEETVPGAPAGPGTVPVSNIQTRKPYDLQGNWETIHHESLWAETMTTFDPE